MRKQSDIRLLIYSLLITAAIGAAAFFLVMLKPWHEGKLIVLAVACAAMVWLGSTTSRLVRKRLAVVSVSAVLVAGMTGLWWYQEKYQPLHPTVHSEKYRCAFSDRIKIVSPAIHQESDARRRLHDQLISSSQKYHRPRVLDHQNYELGTTAIGASHQGFTFRGYAPVRLSPDLGWNENPYNDRTWGFDLHAMGFIERLAEEYRRTNEERWLAVAESYVLDWISDNHDVWFWYPSEFSWHDAATALRLRAWVAFWQVWLGSSLATAEKSSRVLDAMLAHATRLADPSFYTEGHNHGIDQDIALLEFSLQFPQLNCAAAWRDLSIRRLQKQISDTVSKNGIHLEHSPGYHLRVAKLLLEVSELSRLNDPTIAQRLEIDATLERMADFLGRILMPSGYLPRLGDTDTESIANDPTVWSMLANRSERLRDLLSGKQPGDEVVSYRAEGYVVDRSASQTDAAYLLFTAASHEDRGHKHHDDLSFVWYAYGKELLSDAGKYSYNYADPRRKWVVSSAAHNTVLVDGRGFEGFHTSIDEVFHDQRVTVIQASHRNYPGIEHVRRLVYVRPALIFVLDDLNAVTETQRREGERRFEQLFHFGPEMKHIAAHREGMVSVASEAGHDRAGVLVQALLPGRVVTRLIEGQNNPFQGWISLRHGSMQPAKVVSLGVDGKAATFITALKAFRSDEEAKRFSDSVTLEKDEFNVAISWRDETSRHSVRLPASSTKLTRVLYERVNP